MTEPTKIPELKQILGSMIFAAKRPLGIKEMRGCILDVAQSQGGMFAVFSQVKPADVADALKLLEEDLRKARLGYHLHEGPEGFRLESDPDCGPWLKQLLDVGAPNRLSRPALETLAIIAYRQPVSKIEIERIRGVSVDHIIRALLELQLIRIAGRSELPGRPFLYGTTQAFLDHFGLKDVTGLQDYETLRAKEEARRKSAAEATPELPLVEAESIGAEAVGAEHAEAVDAPESGTGGAPESEGSREP